MKKIVLFLASFIFALFATMFVACEDKQTVDKTETTATTETVVETPQLSIADMPTVTVEGQTLVFANNNDYFKAIEILASAPKDERLAWEQKVGFTSVNTVFENYCTAINAVESEDEYYSTIEAFSNVVAERIFAEGETCVDFVYRKSPYVHVANEKGYFRVADEIFRITPKSVQVTYIANKSTLENYSIDNTEVIDTLSVIRNIPYEVEKSNNSNLKLAEVYNATTLGGEYCVIDHDSKCRNERAIHFKIEIFTLEGSNNYKRHGVRVYAVPWIRNYWCNWNVYDNPITLKVEWVAYFAHYNEDWGVWHHEPYTFTQQTFEKNTNYFEYIFYPFGGSTTGIPYPYFQSYKVYGDTQGTNSGTHSGFYLLEYNESGN